jgi:hypothetical protein
MQGPVVRATALDHWPLEADLSLSQIGCVDTGMNLIIV